MTTIEIKSSGEPGDIKVIDSATGEPIGGIQKISWTMDAKNQFSKCIIELINVPVDLKNVEAKVIEKEEQKLQVGDYVKPSQEYFRHTIESSLSPDYVGRIIDLVGHGWTVEWLYDGSIPLFGDYVIWYAEWELEKYG